MLFGGSDDDDDVGVVIVVVARSLYEYTERLRNMILYIEMKIRSPSST